jgi:hypothetical protein
VSSIENGVLTAQYVPVELGVGLLQRKEIGRESLYCCPHLLLGSHTIGTSLFNHLFVIHFV